MALLALSVDLTKVVALSTFGQLVYYALANVSDLKLRSQKRGPRKDGANVGLSLVPWIIGLLVLHIP